jgi:hypothetical protein
MALDESGDLTHEAQRRFGGRKILVISPSAKLRSNLRRTLAPWDVLVSLAHGLDDVPTDWSGDLSFVHTTALPPRTAPPARLGRCVLVGRLGTFGKTVADDVLVMPINHVAVYACLSRLLPRPP